MPTNSSENQIPGHACFCSCQPLSLFYPPREKHPALRTPARACTPALKHGVQDVH